MSTTQTTPYNYSIQAIPAAFAYGLVPHGYYISRLMIATRGGQSNAMPRTNLDVWKNKLPTSLWNHLTRARGTHLNSLEVFPLFASAMVVGNLAGIPAKDMNNYALSFFAARTLYMGLYLTVSHDILAFARTGAWAWSIAIPSVAIWRAGQAMSSEI